MEEVFNKLNEEIKSIDVPIFGHEDKQDQNTAEEDVVKQGLTPRPPLLDGSSDNSRSNSTVSDYSTMGDTHSSAGSQSPRQAGEMSPRKFTSPMNRALENLANQGIRSTSESGVGFKSTAQENLAKDKRYNSTPGTKPEVTSPKPTITMISPRIREVIAATPKSPQPSTTPLSPKSPTSPVNSESGPTSLPAVPFGMDSFGTDSIGSPNSRPLSASASSIPKTGSPGTPKKVVSCCHRNCSVI